MLFQVPHGQILPGCQFGHRLAPSPRQLGTHRVGTRPSQLGVDEGDFFRNGYLVVDLQRNLTHFAA